MSGPRRFRWRGLLVAAATALVVPVAWVSAAGGTGDASTPSDTITVTTTAAHGPTMHVALLVGAASRANATGSSSATTAPKASARAAAAVPGSDPTSGGLPFTGGDVIAVCLIALGMLLSSMGLSGGRRRPYPYARLVD